MKLEDLGVIFIIIILPISLILGFYIDSQINTLNIQTEYDRKLQKSTADAITAFQLNTANSSTYDIINSKLRDINASANFFYTSLADNFNLPGYGEEQLKEYVPALVYIMYDGYYIYSPFINKLDPLDDFRNSATYKEGEKISGLKPYIYYSCRYKVGGNTDFVITYSLDNYIVLQGKINGANVYDAGYLLGNVEYDSISDKVKYNGVEITRESQLKEYIGNTEYTYIKINGVKYYKDNSTGNWFSFINGEKIPESRKYIGDYNDCAYRYYKEAAEFKDRIINTYGLGDLKSSNAVEINLDGFYSDYDIFAFNDNGISIEEKNSDFNQHRLQIIRYCIERNLSIAIANYNNYVDGTKANFQMPELKETDWDLIVNNISLISFMQGMSIGGKIYNGYSIVANTQNAELVSQNSIYITHNGKYYVPNSTELKESDADDLYGAYNIDFKRKSIEQLKAGTSNEYELIYYYPRKELADYNSMVMQIKTEPYDEMITYIKNCGNEKLKKAYYTALGRERYSLYRPEKNPETLKNSFTE